MTVQELIEFLEHRSIDPNSEVIIDGCDHGGFGIELKPLLVRVRKERTVIVADEVTGG